MQMNILGFFKEVFADYAKRFWIFWVILYIASAGAEFFRQILLENMDSLIYSGQAPVIFKEAVLAELTSDPWLILIALAVALFNIWGFGTLYFSFSGLSILAAVAKGFKKLHLYTGYIIVAGVITLLGFLLLSVPGSFLLDVFYPQAVDSIGSTTVNLFLGLTLGLPGLYLLVAFSSAPFILLLENKSIVRALYESERRVRPKWGKAAMFLGGAFLVSAILYLFLYWVIFSLKLAFIPDLSLRAESMLRIFLYSTPWVIAASLYDLALYHLYLRLMSVASVKVADRPLKVSAESSSQQSGVRNYLSLDVLKTISFIVLITFIASFVLVPIPVQAGAAFTGIQSFLGFIMLGIGCVTVIGCAVSFAVYAVQQTAVALTTNAVGDALCDGSYDPIFGTCSNNPTEYQEIRTSLNVKFVKITYAGVPTPEEYAQNQNGLGRTTVRWKADAPQGISENIIITEKTTGQTYLPISGTAGVACTQGEYEATYNLPFEKEFIGEINYSTCIQAAGGRRKREYRAVCSGCGGGGNLVKTEFSSPSLPLPLVDIKANNKDSLTFTPGTPITLSWSSEYALSCTAEGSWSGEKAISGSQTVTPQTGNEIYTLTCRRGDKTGSDSVSSAPASKEVKIFDTSGGSLGGLHISSFNATDPLNPGDTVTISWSVQGAESCEVDNGIGKIPTVGSVNVTFLKTATFTLTCEDKNGNSVSAQKTIQVKKIPGLKEIKPD